MTKQSPREGFQTLRLLPAAAFGCEAEGWFARNDQYDPIDESSPGTSRVPVQDLTPRLEQTGSP